MKPSICKVCRREYVKTRPLQKVCGTSCAISHANALSDKKKSKEAAQDRARTREKLAALETLPELVKKAQMAFNFFIRERDYGKPCICCGKPLELGAIGGGYDCGHFRSVGAAPHLRFNEMNAHAQNKRCNRYLSGNVVEYRNGLIERIGLRNVEILEADNTVRKYTKEGLREIARHYRAEGNRLKKERMNLEFDR